MKINKKTQDTILRGFLFSTVILLIIRFGTFLPVPGVNHNDLAFYVQRHSATKNLINTFSGENTLILGLFTLNIFPYINATILLQLISAFSPKLSKLQKEGDIASSRYINRLTRFLSLGLSIFQSIGITIYLKQILFDWNIFLALDIVLWLTTGSMIVLWLSELIMDYGLGNGTSLLIYANIVSNLPNLLKTLINENKENFNSFSILGTIGVIFVSFYGIVILQKGTRKIPLISSKQLNQSYLQNQDESYLPLRFNQAGVMPIILTTASLVLPNYIVNLKIFQWLSFLTSFKFFYWISYFALILGFSSFYSFIVLNPKDLSDQLQKMAVTVPGLRPGVQTVFYLKQVITRITLIGATMLATVTIVPNLIETSLNITGISNVSITSLLILAGVILDITREIENIYFSTIYNDSYE